MHDTRRRRMCEDALRKPDDRPVQGDEAGTRREVVREMLSSIGLDGLSALITLDAIADRLERAEPRRLAPWT
ncbi:MAG: hypothetical protein AAGI34_06625 [Pseudomonadota bacterium]